MFGIDGPARTCSTQPQPGLLGYDFGVTSALESTPWRRPELYPWNRDHHARETRTMGQR